MTDKPKIVVADPHWPSVPVTFVSMLANYGHANGVANFTFAVARHVPTSSGEIVPDFVVAALLRMDLACVAQLRDACATIIEQNVKPANGTTH